MISKSFVEPGDLKHSLNEGLKFGGEISVKTHILGANKVRIVIKAADEFRDKTTAPNQLWQTDFTYLKVIGWGWFYLSSILDDYSRYIVAWKLCTNMKADDVTATLKLALEASGWELERGPIIAPSLLYVLPHLFSLLFANQLISLVLQTPRDYLR